MGNGLQADLLVKYRCLHCALGKERMQDVLHTALN